ncbi:hypothetical protein D3C72_486200 [compost metagenome]
MVDVHPRMGLPAGHHEVDEALEGLLLLGAGMRPEGLERPVLPVAVDHAEQVLQSAVHVGVALHVEKQVARGGRRQQREAAAGLVGQKRMLVGARRAVVELEAGLVAQPFEGAGGHAAGAITRLRRQGRERRDARVFQLHDLRSPDVRHPAQVVAPVPVRLTARLPRAQPAVVDRIGLGLGRVVGHPVDEAAFDVPVVSREVVHAVRVGLAVAQGHVHPLRREPLHLGEQVRVEAELKQVVRLGAPGHLGVEHLVAPAPQRRGLLHPVQKVRHPAPLAVPEGRLVDDVDAPAHGF